MENAELTEEQKQEMLAAEEAKNQPEESEEEIDEIEQLILREEQD